jgi:hypothetical protein
VPIVASRGREIRKLIRDLADPKERRGAMLRLKGLGPRVVPHVEDELGRLDLETRRALLEALADLETTDARALKARLSRVEPTAAPAPRAATPQGEAVRSESVESASLDALRALPPPRVNERPTISRDRGEAHLALARAGSRLARKDLLHSLATLPPERSRLYCDAAGLIGNAEFLEALARIANVQPDALTALSAIAAREKITLRSKAIRELSEPLRVVVARAIATG